MFWSWECNALLHQQVQKSTMLTRSTAFPATVIAFCFKSFPLIFSPFILQPGPSTIMISSSNLRNSLSREKWDTLLAGFVFPPRPQHPSYRMIFNAYLNLFYWDTLNNTRKVWILSCTSIISLVMKSYLKCFPQSRGAIHRRSSSVMNIIISHHTVIQP